MDAITDGAWQGKEVANLVINKAENFIDFNY